MLGLKFVQYNAYTTTTTITTLTTTTTTTTTTTASTTTTTTTTATTTTTTNTTRTTTATDTSIILQLSLVQCLLRYKKELNSVQYYYLQIALPHTSFGLLNCHVEFEPVSFVKCNLMLCSLQFMAKYRYGVFYPE